MRGVAGRLPKFVATRPILGLVYRLQDFLLLVLYIYPDGTDGSGAHGPTKVSFHCVDRFWNDTHGLFPPLDKDNKTLGYSHRGVSLVKDGRDPFIIKAAGGAGLQQDEFRV